MTESKQDTQTFIGILDSLCDEANIKKHGRQSAIAEIAKVSPQAVSWWYAEGDSKVSIDAQKHLADYFQVSLDYLNGRSRHKQPLFESLSPTWQVILEPLLLNLQSISLSETDKRLLAILESVEDNQKQLLVEMAENLRPQK